MLALVVLLEPNEAWSQSTGICGRNAQIRDLILAQLQGTACDDVTDQQLAGITELDASNNLQGLGITSLRADDFAGLVNLEHLDLRHNNLTELPAGLFQVLNNLKIFRVDHNPETGNSGPTGLRLNFEIVRAGPDTADGTPVKFRVVQGAFVRLTAGVWATERELTSPPPISIPLNRGRIYPEDPRVTIERGALESDVVTVKRTGPGQSYVFQTAMRADLNTCALSDCWTGFSLWFTPLDLGAGRSLSVDATPACATTVTDTSIQPVYALTLTPAPAEEVATEYRWVTDSSAGLWVGNLTIGPSGRSFKLPPDIRFSQLRQNFPGFRGFEFRLADQPGTTASCTWQFDDGGGGNGGDDGGGEEGGGGDDTGGGDDGGGDDDTGGSTPTVRLSASPNPVDEGNPVTVTARLSEALGSNVTMPLTLTAGTAEAGDYGSLPSITISANSTSASGTIPTNEDTDTDDETFTVALGNLPSSVTVGSPSSVEVTIADKTTPTVSLSAGPNPADEGEPVTVTARLSETLSSAVEVPLTLTTGTAEDDDFGSLTGITISAGQTSGTGLISTNEDTDTDDETFTVALGALPASVTEGSPSELEVTIRDTTEVQSRLFVPIVLKSPGRTGGSFFTSEMILTNRGTTTAAIRYTYRAAYGGGSGMAVDSLGAGEQRVIADAIAHLKALSIPIGSGPAGGTLAVDFSNLSFPSDAAVTLRVTTPVEEGGGRAGLSYFGLDPVGLLTGSAFITGLRQNSQDRSNVAVQNAGDTGEGSITLRVTVFSGDSAAPGRSFVLPDRSLPPGGFHQYNGILTEAGFDNGYVKVERVRGTAGYYAYGVINDNFNSDGAFVFPLPESSLVGRAGQTLPVIIESGNFKSELTITNLSAAEKTVDFRFVADAVDSSDDTARFGLTLEAGDQVMLPEIMEEMRRHEVEGVGRADRAFMGALFATPAEGDMGGIVIGARTGSPDRRGGQYSLFYNGVPYGSAFIESAWIYALQQNAENRSNLALVNTGEIDDSSSTFEITIYDGSGVARPSIKSMTLGPRRWTQVNGILGNIRQGYVQVRKTSGNNPFFAYGVINDGGAPGERSGDGAYLPARE